MKKAIWINPVSTGSTSLDISINPHDVDWLAHSEILRRSGYEVFLHEPFKLERKQSSYVPKLFTKDLKDFRADLVLLSVSKFAVDYSGWKYHIEKQNEEKQNEENVTSRWKNLDLVCDFLDSHKGDLHVFIDDPRPSFQSVFFHNPKIPHRILDHICKASIIVADSTFLREELRSRAIISDYWKFVKVGPPRPFVTENKYFCVYPGLKTQRPLRIKQVKEWMENVSGCYTVGEIKVEGVPSLSNFRKVSLSEVLDLTSISKTSLVTGEPQHTWLTPRVIQSLCQGTICSIHPDFPGRHHFPESILRDQTFETAKDFDDSLLTEKVYQRQLDFVLSLSNMF